MAWDFCTDPDFQQQLDWVRNVVINEIEPLDLVKDEMSPESWKRATQPIKQQVKDRGLKSGETSRIADAVVRSLAGLALEAARRLGLGPGGGVPALRGDDAAVDEDVVAGDKG